MKTFFLGASTPAKQQALLTESQVVEGTLLFENAVLQSEIEYQGIISEAMMNEAELVAQSTTAEGKEGDKASFKEKAKALGAKAKANMSEFFKKMVKWFEDRLTEIKEFIANQLNLVAKRIAKLVVTLKKLPNDSAKKVNVNSVYGKLNVGQVDAFASAAIKAIAKEEAVDDMEKFKLEEKDPKRKFETTVAEVIKMVTATERGIDRVRAAQKAIVAKANEGIKKSREAIKEVDRKDEAANDKIKKLRDEITTAQKQIRAANKASAQAVRMLNSTAGAYARGVLGRGVKEEKAK